MRGLFRREADSKKRETKDVVRRRRSAFGALVEKLDGALETARIHHALPDHVAEILNAMFIEFLNFGDVFFVFLGGMKLDRHHVSTFTWAGDVEESVFIHRYSVSLFPRFPKTGSGRIAEPRK